MKKQLLFALLLGSTTMTSAQFKIHSDGKMSFNTTATPSSPISLNGSGNGDFFMSYQGTQRFLYSAVNNDILGSSFILQPPVSNTMSTVLSVYSYPYVPQNSTALGVGLRSQIQHNY